MRVFSTCTLRRAPKRLFSSSTVAQNVVTALEQRGLVADMTSRALRHHVDAPRTVYCGADPSAPSLHLGNLVALIGLLHFQLHGHDILSLIGGATGSVGDPSGRSSERQALDPATLRHNVDSITSQLQSFFDRGLDFASKRNKHLQRDPGRLQVVNNLDWLGSVSLLDFLSGPGKSARVSSMLARESIKTRLNSPSGISFTEFSYNLLQAYDFMHLFKMFNCSIQLGGSDQLGNIMAGIEMMQRENLLSSNVNGGEKHAYGLTLPLLTTSSGAKFGKSAGNAIWMDSQRTHPFDLYQFLLQSSDTDALRYLKVFTFIPLSELQEVQSKHESEPSKRIAQTLLASEVTELIHGYESRQQAQETTALLFGERHLALSQAQASVPESMKVEVSRPDIESMSALQIAVLTGLASSKSKARQLISAGGFYIDGQQVTEQDCKLQQDTMAREVVVLRAGKSQHRVLLIQ